MPLFVCGRFDLSLGVVNILRCRPVRSTAYSGSWITLGNNRGLASSDNCRVGKMLRYGLTAVIILGCVSLTNQVAQNAAGAVEPEKLRPEKAALAAENFRNRAIIDNTWVPMKPGMRWIYEGISHEGDGKIIPHRLIVTITDLTKMIGGVRTLVSYDLDYKDKELAEAELAFYAQDDEGNVWQFGEYPEEYEDGKFIQAPAWIHGLKGARAGIMMPADPRMGNAGFAQGWGPSVGWKDRGIVYQTGQKVSVPAGTFDNVLVIKESAAGEKDAAQLKYYAPGVGNIHTGWLGEAASVTENLELVKIEQLAPEELRKVRMKALRLESDAYRRSKDVYAKTARSVANSQ
jgi:hypothetical protein